MKQPTTPLLALAMLLLAHAPAIGQTTLSLTGGANIASADLDDDRQLFRA